MHDVIDASPFFQRLSALDLEVRKAPNKQAYAQQYKSALANFTPNECQLLIQLASQADAVLAPYPNISGIPWRFAKTCNVESNFPHTLGSVIVIPCTFFDSMPPNRQLEIAIHEKLHVYQRLFPKQTEELVTGHGWDLHTVKPITQEPQARGNPDVDGYLYGARDGSWYMAHLYDAGATKIGQARTYRMPGQRPLRPADLGFPDNAVTQFEHPYEIMAELVSRILLGNTQHAPTQQWMQRWL